MRPDSDSETLLMVPAAEFGKTLDRHTQNLGYRLDMIFPADNPREALMSKGAEVVRLLSERAAVAAGLTGRPKTSLSKGELTPPAAADGSDWVVGRAGMMYRDLIPDRLGGKLIASHIRITNGGVVADYVHYHKIRFQMIYCLKGSIEVVYEDQGEPFWLNPGDCVLQPPEIRHRVLEAAAGSEVIEVTSPAEHKTWVDHELKLPTVEVNANGDFNGQRFVRHIAAAAHWKPSEFEGFESRDTGICIATDLMADVRVLRSMTNKNAPANYANVHEMRFFFSLNEAETLDVSLKT